MSKRSLPQSTYSNKRTKTGVWSRFFLTKPQVGVVLGKGGANVKLIRIESKAYVSILWGKTEERICEVQAPTIEPVVEAVGKIIALMASLGTSEDQKIELRMLAQSANVGCLIGKGGSVISQAVRDHKVSSIKVAKECIGVSTEKIVTITGPASGVISAASWAVSRLQEFPVRSDVITQEYKPSISPPQQGLPFAPPQPQYVPIVAPTGLPAPPPGYQYVQQQVQPGPVPQALARHQIPQVRAPQMLAHQATDSTTAMISVPSQCVAGIIGKGGSVIHAIKKRSGAFISIKDSATASSESTGFRQVQISGSSQAIQAATNAINERIAQLQTSQ